MTAPSASPRRRGSGRCWHPPPTVRGSLSQRPCATPAGRSCGSARTDSTRRASCGTGAVEISPDGFDLDSYDLPRLCAEVLRPLGPGGDRRYREAVHDVRRERALDLPPRVAPPGSVLVLDGLFLHRPELRDAWDFTGFLDVPFAVTFARMALRDGCDPEPAAAANRR